MGKGTACYCINPNCSERFNYFSYQQKQCQNCNTPLVIHPHNILLKAPLHGFQEQTNSEIFTIDNLNIDDVDYPQVIKILRPNCGAIALRLFQQEAFLLQQLRGEAVPKVESNPYFIHALAPVNGQPQQLHCLVMEHIIGESLEQRLTRRSPTESNTILNDQIERKQPLTLESSLELTIQIALDWLKQIAQIIVVIHQHNIIHRDIKPSNIMVRYNSQNPRQSPHGELVLIDFGAAKKLTPKDVEKNSQNKHSTYIFSPGYTAPEQIQGHATKQSDLYAIGCTFMALLTNIHPDEVDYRTLHWHRLIPHKSLRQLLLSLTAINPKDRLANAQSLLDAINKIKVADLTHPIQIWFEKQSLLFIRGGAIALSFCLLIGLTMKSISHQIADQAYRQGFMLFNEINNSADPDAGEQLDKVIGWYRWALLFDSKHIKSHMGKGYICDVQQNFDCALEDYEKVIKYSRESNSSDYVSATNNMALINIKKQDNISQSIKNLESIVPHAQQFGLSAYVHKNLAWGYFLLQNPKAGEFWLTLAAQEIPDNPDVKCLAQAVEQATARGENPSVEHCSRLGSSL